MVRGGTGLDKVTTDGPFVEGKEHIGGFYIVNAEDLDEALAWAAKVVEAITTHRSPAVPGHRSRVRPRWRPLTRRRLGTAKVSREGCGWTTSSACFVRPRAGGRDPDPHSGTSPSRRMRSRTRTRPP